MRIVLLFISLQVVTRLPPTLSLVVCSSLTFSFPLFIIRYYPAHGAPDYSMQCLYLIRHNTNSNTFSATFSNKCIYFLSHCLCFRAFKSGDEGQHAAIPARRCRGAHLLLAQHRDGFGHATASLCGNRHCRWAHMQGIPPLRSLFHFCPRSSSPPRRAL